MTTTTTYFATRDTDDERATDETRAMAHVSIYSGDSLEEAREALIAYMQKEVAWLTGQYVSPTSLRRAAEILEVIDKVKGLKPMTGKKWSAESIEAAGLIWQIGRVVREVA